MFGLIYAVVSYLAFLGSFTYFALFTDGLAVPRTVDGGFLTTPVTATLIDVALISLFGLQHSIMARASWKAVLTRVLPPALERATYVLAASAALVLLLWQWRPLPAPVWSIGNPAAVVGLWVVNALGWLGVPVASLMIDHFDLFGLKQAFAGFRRVSLQRRGFVTPLFYRYIRHPIMTSLLVGLWVTPHMSAGHLLLSVGMSVYILIGVHFEERALIRELGEPYVRYQAEVPRFFPDVTRTSVNDRRGAIGARR